MSKVTDSSETSSMSENEIQLLYMDLSYFSTFVFYKPSIEFDSSFLNFFSN